MSDDRTKITRRQALLGLGALATSCATGPRPGKLGEPAPAAPVDNFGPIDASVIVIGAGLAGLTAALELMTQGIDVLVLEARSRPGGRVRTHRASNNLSMSAELGPWRVPGDHALTLGYARQLGIGIRKVEATNHVFYHVRDQLLSAADVARDPGLLPYQVSARERQLGPEGLWTEAFAPYLARGLNAEVWPWPDDLGAMDRLSLADFLRSRGIGDEGLRMIGDMMGARSFFHTAFLANLREELHEFSAGFVSLEGGNDQLPGRMAKKLGPRVRLGCEVVRIHQRAGSVQVVMRQAGGERALVARRVIVAIPFSCLRNVEVVPRLSPEKQRAVVELNYEDATKVVLYLGQRVWQRDLGIARGSLYTDLPLQSVLYKAPDGPASEGQGGVLTVYAMGTVAELSRARDPIRVAVQWLATVHPGITDHIIDAVAVRWSNERFARGAYPVYLPNQETAFAEHIVAPEHRLHIAGDHASRHPGWMNGAIESGLRAAAEVRTGLHRASARRQSNGQKSGQKQR